MAYWQLGDRDEARRQYDRALAATANRPGDERELRRARAEAAALLNIDPPATTKAAK
jgi:hypothetical protein